MKGNRISRDQDSILAMAGDLAKGLQRLATPLGITGITPAEFCARLAACTEADTAVRLAKAAKQAASRTLQTADDEAREFLNRTKAALVIFLGPRWHAGWEPTGFPGQCTMIPKQQIVRWNLCASLQAYFASHPEKEVPPLGATAAKAGAQYAAIRRAEAALLQATTHLGQQLKARAAAFERLRKTIRSTMLFIANVLPADDPRWHAFGLQPPADPHVPERVTEVTLRQAGPDLIEASWGKAPRATRYRPFVQVVGQEAEPKARAPVYDPRVTLKGFASGNVVRVMILAANATGEAAPSPTADITLP
jgi:hypothetical protein